LGPLFGTAGVGGLVQEFTGSDSLRSMLHP
jgi:hypothetical protein